MLSKAARSPSKWPGVAAPQTHRQPNCTQELQPAEHLCPRVREGFDNRVFDTLPKLTEVLVARCQWLIKHPTVVAVAVGFHEAITV
jgi:hypothetical protein